MATISAGEGGKLSQNIIVLTLTADAMLGVKENCLEAGMNDFMTKPIEIQDISEN